MPVRGLTGLQSDARELARELLRDLPDRWAHTEGVAAAAELAGSVLPPADRKALVSAAWLHDIGYSPTCRRTGFHALDGAIELLDRGFPPRVAALVAHHSASGYEASVRGLEQDLDPFPRETGPVADALTWADMTTDPLGHRTDAESRVAEILDRYAESDPVHHAIGAAAPDLLAAVLRTEDRLAAARR